MTFAFFRVAMSALLLLVVVVQVHAQPVADESLQGVTLLQTVEPSFRVEPVVHRFKARRGALIPFEFTITSTGKLMDIEVRPVNLRQEESGLILHDLENDPSDIVRLHSNTAFQLPAGESRLIKGEITVPLPKTNFLSFGILVKDSGSKPTYDDTNPNATQAGVRFVTQYVLRVDVEIKSAPTSELQNLKFTAGKIVPRSGVPLVQTILENPTNYAFEFHVRASVEMEDASSRTKPFLIGMRSRAEMDEPDRYLIRMMPNSRLRLEAPIADPLLPGQADLRFGISNGRREISGATFAVETSRGEFPAIETQVAFLGKATSISPAQVELGQVSGKPRVAALKIFNRDSQAKQIELKVISSAGEAISNVTIAPKSFSVQPGRTKAVRAVLRSNRDLTQPQYGYIHATTTNADGSESTSRLPLAMYYGEPGVPDLIVSPVELSAGADRPVFNIVVENRSNAFVPIDAQLVVASAQARRMTLGAGYGRWMNPGEKCKLKFEAEHGLEPGEYQLAIEIHTFENHPALKRTVNVRLTPQSGDEGPSVAAVTNEANSDSPN